MFWKASELNYHMDEMCDNQTKEFNSGANSANNSANNTHKKTTKQDSFRQQYSDRIKTIKSSIERKMKNYVKQEDYEEMLKFIKVRNYLLYRGFL